MWWLTTTAEPGGPWGGGGGGWEWKEDEQGLPVLPLLYCERQQRLQGWSLGRSQQPGPGVPGTSRTKVPSLGYCTRGVQGRLCVSVQHQAEDSSLRPPLASRTHPTLTQDLAGERWKARGERLGKRRRSLEGQWSPGNGSWGSGLGSALAQHPVG